MLLNSFGLVSKNLDRCSQRLVNILVPGGQMHHWSDLTFGNYCREINAKLHLQHLLRFHSRRNRFDVS